ncbi:XRE family transcriptional regulator [Nitratireductor aquimarinus]|uniref:XRE family transcriptional regulator n=1 Tax=Nitratireductor aquimarinus TaxID=889300 RepID=A0ABU4APR6_9HYPH|nr:MULTISPECIES: XRE family transcriptional regulator [Alphaproteobacteria]MBY6024153.1 XRE family transcriptional regulator [Nitratireductor sp. DP7N14-4]MBN7758867.1 XRE family transcriptional regulator [Nitratireductor aquimarinus]MBN7760796.1 XRE family transcriptional regulator [Nitratireductor aquibiodomus]MBN7778417.1 XRE family transcriptional regulator [Nitratireductor pacificus]MBN7782739.1 XRE family transcriptional regulator [Nitratireductor pacificus]
MSITPEQCRAARAMTRVSREVLANAANVPIFVIEQYEQMLSEPDDAQLESIETALETLGAEFIDEDRYGGAGVRLRFDATLSRSMSDWESEGGRAADNDVP